MKKALTSCSYISFGELHACTTLVECFDIIAHAAETADRALGEVMALHTLPLLSIHQLLSNPASLATAGYSLVCVY